MGGAQRNARNKKKQAASAVAAARGTSSDRNKVIIGVVFVVLLAVGVIGGVLLTNQAAGAIPVAEVKADYPVQRQEGTVVAGKDTAKATIDVYADFLCPACGQFEKLYGEKINEKINSGELKVRYHVLPFLNSMSNPEGYSRDAANAALCAADGGKFPTYFASLFGKQPAEGGKGYDDNRLIELGTAVGAGPDFEQCVRTKRHVALGEAELKAFTDNQALVGSRGTHGTPTVAHNGKKIEIADANWLDQLIGSAG
ncbi:DsbA family protein [Allokutzneria albata]|uniref:Protein-disulfide isomerase n=1 Tax=Allokutzneria albata TaxID=211114 RepID=A0A1G9YDH5_ALLAB|nr:thioredoxin domain-containing protein [Allokutzneria albata]SDN06565.1 Protein-disulfide isomerase [Allokutzneria albata]